jgi:hypothetical protein
VPVKLLKFSTVSLLEIGICYFVASILIGLLIIAASDPRPKTMIEENAADLFLVEIGKNTSAGITLIE